MSYIASLRCTNFGRRPIIPKMRIGFSLSLLATLSTLAGCSGGSNDNPMGPSGELPAAVVYSAVGASDAMGFGSSVPCLLTDCPDGTGYVAVTTRELRRRGHTVTLVNLGFPGQVLSPRLQSMATSFVPGNFIDNQMPLVRTNSDVVTVFAGGNDVNVIVSALGRSPIGTDPAAFIDQQVTLFGSEFATLISGIRSRTPDGRIVVLNVPNLGGLPSMAGAFIQQRQAAQRAAVRITSTVFNPLASQPNIRVVDLLCDPRLYSPANLYSDGFHPNDAGYAIMAEKVTAAATGASYPAPAASCAQMTLIQ
jgi:lysophospholipase L1-like esterase